MEEQLTREQRISRGDILTSSDMIEKIEQSADGGVAFVRRLKANLMEYIFIKNPKRG